MKRILMSDSCSSASSSDCAICMDEEAKAGGAFWIMPCCQKQYCLRCVEDWRQHTSGEFTCPNCHQPLTQDGAIDQTRKYSPPQYTRQPASPTPPSPSLDDDDDEILSTIVLSPPRRQEPDTEALETMCCERCCCLCCVLFIGFVTAYNVGFLE